jgi:hypothetical protein
VLLLLRVLRAQLIASTAIPRVEQCAYYSSVSIQWCTASVISQSDKLQPPLSLLSHKSFSWLQRQVHIAHYTLSLLLLYLSRHDTLRSPRDTTVIAVHMLISTILAARSVLPAHTAKRLSTRCWWLSQVYYLFTGASCDSITYHASPALVDLLSCCCAVRSVTYNSTITSYKTCINSRC